MKKQEYIDLGLEAGLHPGEIEKILMKIMGISRETLFSLHDISSKYIYEVQKAFYEIKNGQSFEYTAGTAEFYGREYEVSSDVLIPRNDTELLVEKALEKINENAHVEDTIYIDVGTGSGCIPVSIISEMHPLKFFANYAVDISPKALEIAKQNSEKFKINSLTLLQSDLLEVFGTHEEFRDRKLFLTANLPYIRKGDEANMDASVIQNEPHGALYGGEETGFELYKKFFKQVFGLQKIFSMSHIEVLIEIGYDQYEISKQYFEELGLSVEYFYDSSSIARVVYVTGF